MSAFHLNQYVDAGDDVLSLLSAVHPKGGKYFIATVLFSAYCGALIYRAYRNHNSYSVSTEPHVKKSVEINSDVIVINDGEFGDLSTISTLSSRERLYMMHESLGTINGEQTKDDGDDEDGDDDASVSPVRDHPFINVH